MTEPASDDQGARAAIVSERARNVAVVAGAGTGKTKTIIDRTVELLAPRTAATTPVSIKRLAALTFTRRAAGELRFRIREQLLRELEHAARNADERVDQLRDALSNLDAAFIGTIHGFADRLLRLRPVEARLSPAYALVEDTSELVRETFVRMRRAAEAGTLADSLGVYAETLDSDLIREAADTLRAASRAGLQMARAESAYGPLPSVEAVLSSMIDTRDVEVALPPVPDPVLATVRAAADRFAQMVRTMRGRAFGHQQLRRLSHALRRLHESDDPAEAFRVVQEAWRGRTIYKREFDDDQTGWSIYQAVRPDSSKPGSLAEQLRGPQRWLAVRLVRLFPVLKAMYERVKDEHEVVDYLDLLVKLRNVLRDRPEARRFYQGLFDHIFVDEFQDTDPLQCEIVFFLCEDGANAERWDTVHLVPGKLTIVGDPKQSIYRFRRADIVMYDDATQRLRAGGAFEARLNTNFRSRPELIDFYNQQLAKLLGRDSDRPVDAATGRAHYEPLTADPKLARTGVCVHVLPYAACVDREKGKLLAGNGRAIEADVVASYIRTLLGSQRSVRDPDTGVERPVRPGDIAVLACVTSNLPLLLEQLDARGIEYSARGGALFLAHPVARQYLLGLRALADPDDGVARAALMQPPFFALDRADLVRAAAAGATEAHARVEAAKAAIRELRAKRFQQSPGATARDLIEHTALGRAVITGRTGQQTLAALYEIAWELDRRAAVDGLDYDQATALVRSWAEDPVFLDAPEPLGGSAVRVMSIHQAKGLEFPVVILWDGFQTLSDRAGGLWKVERDGAAWALSIGSVAVEHPSGNGLIEREKVFGESERRRMYYVAATRARDLLVLPLPHTKSERLPYATKALADHVTPDLIEQFDQFTPDARPRWAVDSDATRPTAVRADPELQARLDADAAEFSTRLMRAAEPVAVPTAVTALAKRSEAAGGEDATEAERERKTAGARYGSEFGTVVHRALELVLSGAQSSARAAVAVAVAEAQADVHPEASADVERALEALRAAGLTSANGWQLSSEYPVYDTQPGILLVGLVDLLAVSDQEIVVIDFKSDQPRDGAIAAAYPQYAEQLRLYGAALQHSGRVGNRILRLGMLLTATAELRWL
ncbi:MAG TPA: UvrD-helicase domain-containing protein [Candidatus Binatia bacterium]|nr:UvrD-helicase domain-containing protein [Candidatus Binatia bacterium]